MMGLKVLLVIDRSQFWYFHHTCPLGLFIPRAVIAAMSAHTLEAAEKQIFSDTPQELKFAGSPRGFMVALRYLILDPIRMIGWVNIMDKVQNLFF